MGIWGQAYGLRLYWEVGPQGNKSKGEREKAGKGVGIKYPTSSGFTTKQQGAWPGDVFQRGFVECGGRAGAYLLSLIGNPSVHFQCVPCSPPGSQMLGAQMACLLWKWKEKPQHPQVLLGRTWLPRVLFLPVWERLCPKSAFTWGHWGDKLGARPLHWARGEAQGQRGWAILQRLITGPVGHWWHKMQSLHVAGHRRHEPYLRRTFALLSSHSSEPSTFVRH